MFHEQPSQNAKYPLYSKPATNPSRSHTFRASPYYVSNDMTDPATSSGLANIWLVVGLFMSMYLVIGNDGILVNDQVTETWYGRKIAHLPVF